MAVDLVPTVAAVLKSCLCEAFALNPAPPLFCCYRLPGEVAMDMDINRDLCCDGLAYVQVGDMWVSSNSFPEQDIVRQAQAKCGPPSWGFDLKFGILRCVPVVGETENDFPTCAQWDAAAAQQMADSASLRQAACCFRNAFLALSGQYVGMSVVIGRMGGGSPQGGCSDRFMAAQVQIPTVCDGC